MRKRNKEIQLTSYEDLLGMDTVANQVAGQLLYVPLTDLYEFKDHPLKVLDDEKMQETVESIKNYGVLTPGIVRPRQDGGYEIIAGHRRKRGCELAGIAEMPVFVRNYNDDEVKCYTNVVTVVANKI